MIVAAALLMSCLTLGCPGVLGPVVQDLEAEAAVLMSRGRYLEALQVIDSVSDPARAARLRSDTLWAAGDLGGALRAGLSGLEQEADPYTRRRLFWDSLQLCLQLGEAQLAQDLLPRLEEAVASAPDLDEAGRALWREGWSPGTGLIAARTDTLELAERLASAASGVSAARGVTALVTLLVLAGMAWLARRA